mmetsp:Transcript_1731/g.3668  ORF Transcript_1731/g.3668 Transcript_1731/m.3668 type:complete len:224 (+) Transcript_1731:1529-2200(+)
MSSIQCLSRSAEFLRSEMSGMVSLNLSTSVFISVHSGRCPASFLFVMTFFMKRLAVSSICWVLRSRNLPYLYPSQICSHSPNIVHKSVRRISCPPILCRCSFSGRGSSKIDISSLSCVWVLKFFSYRSFSWCSSSSACAALCFSEDLGALLSNVACIACVSASKECAAFSRSDFMFLLQPDSVLSVSLRNSWNASNLPCREASFASSCSSTSTSNFSSSLYFA